MYFFIPIFTFQGAYPLFIGSYSPGLSNFHSNFTYILLPPHICQGGFREATLKLLYIPHCSDGPYYFSQQSWISHNFISHIVQMDHIRVPNFLKAPPALYPTLFRWTVEISRSWFYDDRLYIPHCSDGPLPLSLVIYCLLLFISHIVQMDL